MKFERNDKNYVYGFVGKNVAKYRKLKGWTQEELADKTDNSYPILKIIHIKPFL